MIQRSTLLALTVLGALFAGSVALSQGSGVFTVAFSNINNHDVVANVSGSAAPPADTTVTALLDDNFGATQGNILYRNATGWVSLAPGTAGNFLRTGGAAANPSYGPACIPAGSVGQLIYDSGVGTCPDSAITLTAIGNFTDPVAAGASAPGLYFTGSAFSGGSGTTTFPFEYMNFDPTAPTTFNVNGSIIGVNELAAFTGLFLDLHLGGGGTRFNVDYLGNVSAPADIRIGAAPTLGGSCATSAYAGGNTAGFLTATCTAQTIVFTFAKSVTNGYVCQIADETTPADAMIQTAHGVNSCTVTGTTGAGDHLTLEATGA